MFQLRLTPPPRSDALPRLGHERLMMRIVFTLCAFEQLRVTETEAKRRSSLARACVFHSYTQETSRWKVAKLKILKSCASNQFHVATIVFISSYKGTIAQRFSVFLDSRIDREAYPSSITQHKLCSANGIITTSCKQVYLQHTN